MCKCVGYMLHRGAHPQHLAALHQHLTQCPLTGNHNVRMNLRIFHSSAWWPV